MLRQKVVVNGKRVGQGFVCSRIELANALRKASTIAVKIGNITIGRDGLAKLLKYMHGPATVKIVPRDGYLCIQAGSNYAVEIQNWKWIKTKDRTDAEWFNFVTIEVGSRAKYIPNVGAQELAKAINRALLTAGKEKDDPMTSKIVFNSHEGILKICSTDRFKLTVYEVYSDAQIQGSIEAKDAKTIAKALAKSEKARIEVYTKEHSIYSSDGPTTSEVSYVAIYADQQKFEMQLEYAPFPALLNPEEHIPESAGYALIDAREFQNILKGLYIMNDNEYTTTKPVFITLKLPYLELRVEDGNEITLATNLEIEGEGEGTTFIDSKNIIPLLKDNRMIELVFPKDPSRPLWVRNSDYWHLVMPLAMPSVPSQTEEKTEEKEMQEVA